MGLTGEDHGRRSFLRAAAMGTVASWQLAQQIEQRGVTSPVPPPHDSTLRADTIAEVVRTCWGLSVVDCHLYSAGVNHTYRVQGEDQRWWLRLTRRNYRDRSVIEGEVAMLRHLRGEGLPVVEVVRNRDDRGVVDVEAPEGTRCAVLFRDIGLRTDLRVFTQRARHLGSCLARLHATADTGPQVSRPRVDCELLFRRPPRILAPYLSKEPRLLAELTHFCHALGDLVQARLPDHDGWGFCHGDLHPGNVFFDPQHQPVIIDFDHSFHGYRAFDVAIHLFSIGPAMFFDPVGRSLRRRWWKHLFTGYDNIAGTDGRFRALVEAFIPARMLWFFCDVMWFLDSFGYRVFEPDRIRRMLWFAQLWARELRLPLGVKALGSAAGGDPGMALRSHLLAPPYRNFAPYGDPF